MNKGTTEIQKQLGKNIAIARKKAGITQEQLAERIDVQTLSISRIERGSVAPSLSTISKIAKILNIPITRLFINSQITQNIAQDITDLLTTLSENHRTFIYPEVPFFISRIQSISLRMPYEYNVFLLLNSSLARYNCISS